MMGHNGSKRSPVPVMEGDGMRDLEKADSLEVDESYTGAGGDEDLGGGGFTLTGKKRKDERDSAFENGRAAKRVLMSDSTKWHVDAESAGGAAVDVIKGDNLEKMHAEAIAKPDESGTLTFDACNGDKDREIVDVKISGTVEESAKCFEINADDSHVASVMEVEANGLHIQGSTLESGDERKKEDEKVHLTTTEELNVSGTITGGESIDDLQANKGCNGPCKGEVIDPSATTNDDEPSMGLSRSNPASGPESIEQEDTVTSTEGVILLSGDQKVEKHCCVDYVHKETELSLVKNGMSTTDKHNTLTDCTNQEGMGSPVIESKEGSAGDIVFTRRKSIPRKTPETKQVKSEEEVKFEKRVTRSATVRQREVSGSTCKSQNVANKDDKEGKEDILHRYTRKASGAVSSKAHHAELVECDANSKKQTQKGKVTARRNSDVISNDDLASMHEPDVKLNLKSQPLTKRTTEDAVSVVDQNISSAAITERNDTELTDSEGVKSENKIAMQKSILSVGAKIVASKKRIMESGLDKICGESPVMTPSMKKTRSTPSDNKLDQSNKSSGKKLMGNSCGSDKREIFTERQRCSQAADLSRSVNRTNKKVCKLSDNESDDNRNDSDTSNRKSYRGRTRGSASVVLKEQDSSESEEVIIVRKDRKKERDPGQKQRAGSISKHYSRSSKPASLVRAVSVNSDTRSSSKQAEKGEMKVPKDRRKENNASSAKSSSPSEPINTGSTREEKQKISEQIKGILLDAGWKIDLRPRNGRNYLDSVYIPPSGKGSYWSVTKAYAVYLENMESEQKDSTEKKSVDSPGKRNAPAASSLSEEILSKLKRMVVNRRRTKSEIQKLRKKKHSLLKKFKNSKSGRKGKNKTSNSRKLHLGSERKKRSGCALLARGSNKEAGSSTGGFVSYEWKRTIFSWLIDLDILSANAGLKCMDETRSKVLLEGVVTRDGINCSCCSKIFALLEFVAHAGGGQVTKPYRNVLVNGLDIDLLQCLINAWDKQSDSERQGFFQISTEGDDPNDDTCGICGDGGNLICCDGCPSTFHMSCLDLEALPSDDWRCANCSCKFCQEHSSHDAQDIAEVDFSLQTCSQCEEKYHPACSPDIDNTSSVSNQATNSFCQQSCRLIFEELQNLLAVKKDLESGFSCRIIQRIHEDVPETVLALDERIECNSKIAVAFSLMDECFVPIVDQRTGINLIRNVVYNCGSNFGRLDFRGFYIFMLERGDEIISAASVRIHGTKLAEMPFIGTRNMYRRQGMCRRLLDGIEMILCDLKVEKLVIPAINELVDTWTSKFGFSTLEDSHKKEVKSTSMLVFPGTGLLQKPLLNKNALLEGDPNSEEAGAVFPGDKCDKASQVANEDSLCSIPNAETQSSDITDNLDSCKDAGACND